MTDEETVAISLSERAAGTVRSLLSEQGLQPTTAGLRISVERGGCAGLTYQLELAEESEPTDYETSSNGTNVFVDPDSRQYLHGATFELDETPHGTGFRIDNPNAEQECGCGLSFR